VQAKVTANNQHFSGAMLFGLFGGNGGLGAGAVSDNADSSSVRKDSAAQFPQILVLGVAVLSS